MPASEPIDEALARIRAWGEGRDWVGWDPYDGLNAPAAPFLTAGTAFGRRLLTQAVKLSPINLRPLLAIPPERNAKAIALLASGYARLAATGDAPARQAAARWLDWLVANPAPRARPRLAWGYPFDVQTRVFRYRRGEPNTIATVFAGHALLDGCELLEDRKRHDAVASTASFLLERMAARGPLGAYFRYIEGQDELVHNANALACGFLARAGRLLDEERWLDLSRQAILSTLVAQRPDGAWPYADGHGWVDNFHTAYVLESLAECAPIASAVEEPLEEGLAFWSLALFLADGTPKYYAHRPLPLDAHCYAQAIETWLAVRDRRRDAVGKAECVARRLVEHLLDRDGHVHFQRRRLWTSRVPYVRWTTAPTFRAFARLALTEHERGEKGASTHARLG